MGPPSQGPKRSPGAENSMQGFSSNASKEESITSTSQDVSSALAFGIRRGYDASWALPFVLYALRVFQYFMLVWLLLEQSDTQSVDENAFLRGMGILARVSTLSHLDDVHPGVSWYFFLAMMLWQWGIVAVLLAFFLGQRVEGER